MPKMTILVTNFKKSPSAGGSPLNLQYWGPKVPWSGRIVFIQADYDEIELQEYSYDVLSVTSSALRHW